MTQTIQFNSADLLDGNTLIITLSDGSRFKLNIAQMLSMEPEPLPMEKSGAN